VAAPAGISVIGGSQRAQRPHLAAFASPLGTRLGGGQSVEGAAKPRGHVGLDLPRQARRRSGGSQ